MPLVEARLPSGRTGPPGHPRPAVPSTLAPRASPGVVGLRDPAVVRAASSSGADPGGGHRRRRGLRRGRPRPSAGPRACAPSPGSVRALDGHQLASTYGSRSLYAAGRIGAGQTVGIFELEPFTASDIAAYQACYGTDVPVTTMPVDGGATGSPGRRGGPRHRGRGRPGPRGAPIDVYSGPNDGARVPSTPTSAMVDRRHGQGADHQLGPVRAAWMDPATSRRPRPRSSQMAAHPGPDASWPPRATPARPTATPVETPNDDRPGRRRPGRPARRDRGRRHVTRPRTRRTARPRLAWDADGGAGGGGNSTDFAAPAWQQVPGARVGRHRPTTAAPAADQQCREVPDVAASADPNYGDIVYFDGAWVADRRHQCGGPAVGGAGGRHRSGVRHPGRVRSTRACTPPGRRPPFNDITTGRQRPVRRVTAASRPRPGYDLATGWGSPRAAALLGPADGVAGSGCPTVTGLSPSSGPAAGGTTGDRSRGPASGPGTPTVAIRRGPRPRRRRRHGRHRSRWSRPTWCTAGPVGGHRDDHGHGARDRAPSCPPGRVHLRAHRR